MNIQSNLGMNLGLAAAATMAVGLVSAGAAGAAPLVPAPASASVANNTLTVRGTNGADAISIAFAANAANTVLVDFGDGVDLGTGQR